MHSRFCTGKILSFIVLVLVCSCETDIVPQHTTERVGTSGAAGTTRSSHYVSYEEALDIADSFFRSGNEVNTRSTVAREVGGYGLYTSDASEGEAISFHIINYANDKGFAIVSADDRTTSIYAYAYEGNFNIADTTFNTGLSIFLEGAVASCRDEIAQADTSSVDAALPIKPFLPAPPDGMALILYDDTTVYGFRSTTSTTTIDNMLRTQWNQDDPYNYYCPLTDGAWDGYNNRCPAGCVAIAMGQIMAYYRYPSSYNGVYFNWNYILSSSSYAGKNAEVDAPARETAKFIYRVGLAAGVTYTPRESYSDITKSKSAFEKMGYTTSAVTTYSDSYVYSSIQARRPVYIRGVDPSRGGHAWVIDGAQVTTTTNNYYEPVFPYTYLFSKSVSTYYFHCNWGWGGGSDGYYKPSAYQFGNDKQILYNIHP